MDRYFKNTKYDEILENNLSSHEILYECHTCKLNLWSTKHSLWLAHFYFHFHPFETMLRISSHFNYTRQNKITFARQKTSVHFIIRYCCNRGGQLRICEIKRNGEFYCCFDYTRINQESMEQRMRGWKSSLKCILLNG